MGIRPGEKLHEEMITQTDALSTVELDRYYVILPTTAPGWNVEKFIEKFNAKRVPEDFHYDSANNSEWLDAEQIREEIRLHVDPTFQAAG